MQSTATTTIHALYASLHGPDDQYFGCFLIRNDPDGSYTCPDTQYLDPGVWTVNVTLIRSPSPSSSLSRQVCWQAADRLLKKTKTEALKPVASIVDYILEADFNEFKDYLKCVHYPYQLVVFLQSWEHVATGLRNDGDGRDTTTTNSATTTTTTDADNDTTTISDAAENSSIGNTPGQWVSFAQEDEAIPERFLSFSTDAMNEYINVAKINHVPNADRGLTHLFLPLLTSNSTANNNKQLFLTREQVFECLTQNNINLTLAGDSRTFHIVAGLITWLKSDTMVSFIPLYRPYRLGLRHSWITEQGDELRRAIRSGGVLVINSILHDIAEFYFDTRVGDVRRSWSNYTTCPEACDRAGEVLALQCGCHKQYAIRAYVDMIDTLKQEIAGAVKEQQGKRPRIFWVSMHKRPPAPPQDVFYEWQTADIVQDLESRAARELEGVGVKHLDLRWMTASTPAAWWDDPVHFGKYKNSLFSRALVHAIVKTVCDKYAHGA